MRSRSTSAEMHFRGRQNVLERCCSHMIKSTPPPFKVARTDQLFVLLHFFLDTFRSPCQTTSSPLKYNFMAERGLVVICRTVSIRASAFSRQTAFASPSAASRFVSSTTTSACEAQQARSQRLIQLRRNFSAPPSPEHTAGIMSFKPLYSYVDGDTLAETVRKHASDPNQKEVAIVDVRGKATNSPHPWHVSAELTALFFLPNIDCSTDDDFVGGNIVTAKNHPSSRLDDEIEDLVYGPLKDYKQVIFHCHLSQARGPKAAGKYAQARQEALDSGKLKTGQSEAQPKQQVLVLRGGFKEFQDKYKKDPQVIEKYDASAWEYRD